jgi:hypothetical protein
MIVALANRLTSSRASARSAWWPPVGLVATIVVMALLGPSQPVAAQSADPVLEALRHHRQAVRTAQVLSTLPSEATLRGPAELPVDLSERRRILASLPLLSPPPLPPLTREELLVATTGVDVQLAPRVLEEMRWTKVAPGEERAYMYRFAEVMWTNATALAATPVDTMATPDVRARLNTIFGMPTRTPAVRSRSEVQGGSPYVQFEYWFAVNDTIPVVVMDRAGPFGRGLLVVGNEEHADVLGSIVEDLSRQVVATNWLMPYVDYYESEERGQWYRTGYDGTRFYVLEIDRPRWARRTDTGGHWFDFR